MWVRIDDGCLEHPKIEQLSDAAFRLWMQGLTYCGRALTDGRIPGMKARGWAFERAQDRWQILLDELVSAGLWEVVEDGYFVHDYLDYNPSRQSIEGDRARKRRWERTRRGTRRFDAELDGQQDAEHDGQQDAELDGQQDAEHDGQQDAELDGQQDGQQDGRILPSRPRSRSPSPSRPPEAAAARGRARDADGYAAEVWRAYQELVPRTRSPSRGELAVIRRWEAAGVPAAHASHIIRKAATVPDTLIWYEARVLERWAAKELVDLRTALLDELAVRDPPPFPDDVAGDVCDAIEAAQTVEELEAIEREWLRPPAAAAGGRS